MLLQHKAIEIFADYHQFYLWDRGMDPRAPENYSDEDVRRRIKTGPHVVVIQPERSTTVAVEIEIHDSEPLYDAKPWDHIAEASLVLPTGQLEVEECTGGQVASFRVTPGCYRVRAFFGGFETIDDSGLEGNDHYRVVLWPAPHAEVCVVKQWAMQKGLVNEPDRKECP